MVTIRRAREEDAAGICEAHTRSIREICSSHYSASEIAAWTARLVPGAHLPAIQTQVVFVASDEQGITGFGEFHPATGEIRAVYVHPRAVKKGVGAALLAALEDAARAAGVGAVHLVASLNAVGFYERAGFQVQGHSTLAMSPTVTIACVKMGKELTTA